MIQEILGKKVELVLKNKTLKNHYKFTPYSFEPAISVKLFPNPQIDLGQGLLECIKNASKKNK